MVGAGGVTGVGKGGGGPECFAAGGSIGGGGGVGGTAGAGGFGISREVGSFMEMGGSTGFGSGEGGGGVTGCRAGVGGAAVARRLSSSWTRVSSLCRSLSRGSSLLRASTTRAKRSSSFWRRMRDCNQPEKAHAVRMRIQNSNAPQ